MDAPCRQVKFSLNGIPKAGGEFEIMAITAGVGNGWTFDGDVLKASLNLWDGAHCFIDHAWFSRSIKDLAGVCSEPRWDEAAGGIVMKVKAAGPAGPVLAEVGRQVLGEEGKGPKRVGFSADVVFTALGRKVESILRVNSVDLVLDPARGGMFKRVLNSLGKDISNMDGENQEVVLNKNQAGGEAPTPAPEETQSDLEAIQKLLEDHAKQAKLNEEQEAIRATHLQQCEYLLDIGLASAKLPAPLAERIRKQFAGRVYKPAELSTAIEDGRQMMSELTAGDTVKGPRISGVFSSGDQITAAVEDMFEVPRSQGLEKVKAARLGGVRELYLMLTGDYDLHGGYYGDRVQLATTADFTGLVKNAMNKVVVNTWEQLGKAGYDWWKRICVTEHFGSLQAITGTLVGTVGDLPSVAEGGAYTELNVGDSPETASFTKYGGYIPLTLELIDRDETRKLKAYPRELAAAGLRKISKLVSEIFTASSGVGPILADGGALFNATAVTTAGGHANLLTTALNASQWDTVSQAVYDQPMLVKNASGSYGIGPKMAINPRYCLVPRALQLTAMKVLYPSLENAANIYSENQQRGQPGDVVTVPEWTDSTNWAAVCDPLISPAIYVGDRFGLLPEIFIAGDNLSPAVFTNDEHRLKVRHFLAVWVNDFRPLHKSNVAG